MAPSKTSVTQEPPLLQDQLPPDELVPKQPRRRWPWPLAALIVIVALVVYAVRRSQSSAADRNGAKTGDASASTGGRAGRGGAQGRTPVGVAPVVSRDFPVYLEGLGTVTAYNTVTVKSRVDGQIVQVNFQEGQNVTAGQTLIQIDPRPYEAVLHQAEANLARDESALKDLQTNLARFEALYQAGVIAKQQLDTQGSQVGQLQGSIGADRAQIENARLNVTYCRVAAPISGRAGLRMVDVGNVIHASDPNGVLVITQVQPIAVVFTLPEDNIPSVVNRLRTTKLPVDAFDRGDKTQLASGTLETIDNTIDPTTGTVKLKAIFPNRDGELFPNQFVNVHLQLQTLSNATLIPASAVQRGQQGNYVFTVDQDNKAQMRPVQIALTQADTVVVSSGVNAGERVVTDGQERLQAGMQVEITGAGGGGRRNAQAGPAGSANAGSPANPTNNATRGGPNPGRVTGAPNGQQGTSSSGNTTAPESGGSPARARNGSGRR
jgi:membrane fusion protein, multidrug efflux system